MHPGAAQARSAAASGPVKSRTASSAIAASAEGTSGAAVRTTDAGSGSVTSSRHRACGGGLQQGPQGVAQNACGGQLRGPDRVEVGVRGRYRQSLAHLS